MVSVTRDQQSHERFKRRCPGATVHSRQPDQYTRNRREAADDEGGSWGSRKAVLGNTFLFLSIKILKRIEIGHVALCGRASFVTLLPQPPTC